MSLRTFGRIAGLLFVTLLVYLGYRLATQWHPEKIGDYEIRRNTVTGIVQIQTPQGWKTPFADDPYAEGATPDDLRRVQIDDVVWGDKGVLCARARVSGAPDQPVKGRLAFQIRIYSKEKKRFVDKEVRATVDWPGGTDTPFALRTTASTPDPKETQTTIRLLPALYSGA